MTTDVSLEEYREFHMTLLNGGGTDLDFDAWYATYID